MYFVELFFESDEQCANNEDSLTDAVALLVGWTICFTVGNVTDLTYLKQTAINY